MVRLLELSVLVLFLTFTTARPSFSQAAAPPDDGWKVSVYPVLAWVPLGIAIDVNVPPGDGTGGGAGEIVDGRFDGAYLGGVSAARGKWRIDADVIWAAIGGDRPERPALTVDVDLIYGHAMGGYEVANDLYVTGGVRRVAVDYDIKIGTQPNFNRKPGFWDPLIGLGWHRQGDTLDWHVTFEGGGFGAGADVDLGAGARFDWKPVSHFGITAGYNLFYFEVDDTVATRTFTVKQTLHGPVIGIGIYF